MKNVIIRQTVGGCQVWHGDRQVFAGGRVAAKCEAKRLHDQTGDPVFNYKKSGALVLCYGKAVAS